MNVDGVFIGVDLGGTNVRAGAFTSHGTLLATRETLIEAGQGPERGLLKIGDLIQAVSASVPQVVKAIGIGSTGPLDRENGAIQNPYTLPGWENVNIVAHIRKRLGTPVALENDADAAALGESWVGAGRGLSRLAMVTIGTGVGFGFVLNGEIYRGAGGFHPEGGHIIIDPSGPSCYCGANGCWESLVAGPAIAQEARLSPEFTNSEIYRETLRQNKEVDAAMVFSVARSRDRLAQQIVKSTADYIAIGLVHGFAGEA